MNRVAAAEPRQPAQMPFPAWLRAELRSGAAIYGMLGLFLAYTVALSIFLDKPLLPFVGYYLAAALRATILLGCGALAVTAIRALMQGRDSSPLAYMLHAIVDPPTRQLAGRFIYGCTVLAVFMGAFLYNKALIPVLSPFSWDPVFAAWDRALFGGVQPWTLLQPLLGRPAATIVLDYLYAAWVPLVFLFWAGLLALAPQRQALRRQYWLATMTSWILIGLIMATLMSSAGPCYVPALFPALAAEFAGLNAYLDGLGQGALLPSALSKAYLWNIYSGTLDAPGGISAMPSMHNAQAALFAAAAYRIDRRFGHLMSAFALIIFVGSIHLAWHYAVDGIVGMAAALVVWWVVGRILALSRMARAA